MPLPSYVSDAIRHLNAKSRFFGHIAMSLEWKTTSVAIMATDGQYLYYDPERYAAISLDHRASIIVHEIIHILNEHPIRARNYPDDHFGFNVSADMAINPICEQYGFDLPATVLRPPAHLVNRSMEYIYASLYPPIDRDPPRPKEPPTPNDETSDSADEPPRCPPQPGDDSPDANNTDKDQTAADDTENTADNNDNGDNSDSDPPSAGNADEEPPGTGNPPPPSLDNADKEHGSNKARSTDGERQDGDYQGRNNTPNSDKSSPDNKPGTDKNLRREWTEGEKAALEESVVLPLPDSDDGLTPEECIANHREAVEALKHQAVRMAIAHGEQPFEFLKEIIKLKAPEVPWTEELEAQTFGRSTSILSWNRPSRRYLAHNQIMPSSTPEGIGRVCIAYDTSISQTTEQLQYAAQLIGDMLQQYQVDELYLVFCDTTVRYAEWVYTHDLVDSLDIKGRGGTLVSPVFAHLADQDPFDIIIYQTDLEIPPDDWALIPHQEANLIWLTDAPFLTAPIGTTIRFNTRPPISRSVAYPALRR